MRIPLPTAKRRARIEIIPLIDIVFFLLATFVMVSMSMVKNQGVPVKLPAAATSAPEKRDAHAVITVTEAGDVYFDKDKLSLDELGPRLDALKASDPDAKVFVNGDENAKFGAAIRVLDEARKRGIEKVSIQTKGMEAA